MKPAIYSVCAFILLPANIVFAQFTTPAEGEYVLTDGSWGILQVQKNGIFSIETTGANGHICGLDGTVINGLAKTGDSSCRISFTGEGQGVKVISNGAAACSDFCGVRASFEGVYKKPPPLCVRKNIEEAKRQFKKNYSDKNYAVALTAIDPIATQCIKLLYWIEAAWILNDLAITQFKLGNKAACLQTLQMLAVDAAKSDQEIIGNYPPSDSDAYLPALQATRTNLRLCSKK